MLNPFIYILFHLQSLKKGKNILFLMAPLIAFGVYKGMGAYFYLQDVLKTVNTYVTQARAVHSFVVEGAGTFFEQDFPKIGDLKGNGEPPSALSIELFTKVLARISAGQKSSEAKALLDRCIEQIQTNQKAPLRVIKDLLAQNPVTIDGFSLPTQVFSGPSQQESLEELYQRYKEQPPHPLSYKDDEHLDSRAEISSQLKHLEELLTLKGLYSVFTLFGGVASPFEAIIFKTQAKMGHKLNGNLDASIISFKEVLLASMKEAASTSSFQKFTLIHLILPGAVSQISSHAKYATRALFGHLDARVIEHKKNGNHPSSDTSLLKKLIMIFDKYSHVLKNAERQHCDPMDNRTFPQYVFDALNGTPLQRRAQFKELTVKFIDSCMFKPIRLGSTLKEIRKNLKKDVEGSKFNTSLRTFLTPFYYVAITVIFLFEMIIVKPAEALLNFVLVKMIKHFAVKTNLAGYIAEETLAVLSGKDGERETELLDNIFLIILNKANTALQKELSAKSSVTETKVQKEVSHAEKQEVKEFLRSLFKVASLHHKKTSKTFEEQASELPFGIGESAFEKGLEEVAPLLVNLYKQITSKKFLEKTLASSLVALNRSLAQGLDTATSHAEQEVKNKKAQARSIAIKNSLKTTGQRLLTLLKKTVEEPADNLIQEHSQRLRGLLLTKLSKIQDRIEINLIDIRKSTYSNEDREEKLGVIDLLLDHYVEEMIEERAKAPEIDFQLNKALSFVLKEMMALKKIISQARVIYSANLTLPSCSLLVEKIQNLNLNDLRFLEKLHIEPDGVTKRHDLHHKLLDALNKMKKIKHKEIEWKEQAELYTQALTTLENSTSRLSIKEYLATFPETKNPVEEKIYDQLNSKLLHLPFKKETFKKELCQLVDQYKRLKKCALEKRVAWSKTLEQVLTSSKEDAEDFLAFLAEGKKVIDLNQFSDECTDKLESIKELLHLVKITPPVQIFTGGLNVASRAIGAAAPFATNLFESWADALLNLIKDPAFCGAILHKIIAPALLPSAAAKP